jgi:membrane associated rhomboid family serine protease
MLPIRDINPTVRFPLITLAIIGLNIAVFLIEFMLQAAGQFEQFVATYAVIPIELTHNIDLPPASLRPAFLTVLTSMFMHGGLVHLFGNMLYLWIFGNNVEDEMGHGRFVVFYLLCGTAAALAQVIANPNSRMPMIGASGAIAGVLGAYLVMHPRAQVETVLFFFLFIRIVRLPAVFVLGFWFVIQLFQGMASVGMPDTGGVAWFAHIGGFITGVLLINLFRRRQPIWRM